MFRAREMVLLTIDKIHGEGADAMSISLGSVGMILTQRDENTFVVDFGAEGQWNCLTSELTTLSIPNENSRDSYWDEEIGDEEEESSSEGSLFSERYTISFDSGGDSFSIGYNPSSSESRINDQPLPGGQSIPHAVSEELKKETKTIDFDRDLEEMMKKLSKEKQGR